MEPNGAPPKRNTLGIVLIIISGGIFVVLIGCGGCAVWLYSRFEANTSAAEAAANAFLDELQSDRIDEA
jgi:hypothetical protein